MPSPSPSASKKVRTLLRQIRDPVVQELAQRNAIRLARRPFIAAVCRRRYSAAQIGILPTIFCTDHQDRVALMQDQMRFPLTSSSIKAVYFASISVSSAGSSILIPCVSASARMRLSSASSGQNKALAVPPTDRNADIFLAEKRDPLRQKLSPAVSIPRCSRPIPGCSYTRLGGSRPAAVYLSPGILCQQEFFASGSDTRGKPCATIIFRLQHLLKLIFFLPALRLYPVIFFRPCLPPYLLHAVTIHI